MTKQGHNIVNDIVNDKKGHNYSFYWRLSMLPVVLHWDTWLQSSIG